MNLITSKIMEAVGAKALESVNQFRSMTYEQFAALPPQERGFMAGAIMGNYSTHHPKEAFEFLQQLMAKDENRRGN